MTCGLKYLFYYYLSLVTGGVLMKKHKISVIVLLILAMISLSIFGCGETSEKTSSSKEDDENTPDPVPIDVAMGYDFGAVLYSDGSVYEINGLPGPFRNEGDVIDIDCGWITNAYIGLKSDGTVVSNDYRIDDVEKWTDIVKIGMGNYSDSPIAGLKKDGTVVYVHTYKEGYDVVDEWTDVKDISVGDSNIAAITNSGEVLVAGENNHGACNVDDWGDYDIVQVSVGGGYTAGLLEDGTVITTELIGTDLVASKYIDEVEDWTDITQICAGLTQIAGIKSDGRVVVAHTGEYNYDVSGWENIVKLVSGEDALIGITEDGKVYITGDSSRYK